MLKYVYIILYLFVFTFININQTSADNRPLVLATTTSVDSSGLLKHLLSKVKEQTNIKINVVVRGTGAVLNLGIRGDVDIVLTHDRNSEDSFVKNNHGSLIKDVMSSHYMIVGPDNDPAKIAGLLNVSTAFNLIANTNTLFLSRGDNSGTHKTEILFWNKSGVNPKLWSGKWYRETGSGMGATLNMASVLGGYLITESGSWFSFGNRGKLTILMDQIAPNPYRIILVNPEKHPHVLVNDALSFINWLTGPIGQNIIDNYEVNGNKPYSSASKIKTIFR
ncbi:MAG: tungsten ABC transporter substrate-binding protein [Rhodospirillaceae bacterium]|nr:tungsten ABC transporter substrate-binding protein [Rhodospirillaceae bacterium]|tara:strand:+ start:10916 stop:11749 length:834 start_codon:yes stop_codon:yes gene_type:complete